MTRSDEIHPRLLRHADRLTVIVWCAFFGVLGVAGQLTPFLLGSSLGTPSSAIRLDAILNVSVGVCCLTVAAIVAHGLRRRP